MNFDIMNIDIVHRVAQAWMQTNVIMGYYPVCRTSRNNTDVFLGYSRNPTGRVNNDTHYHIFIRRGMLVYQLTCNGRHNYEVNANEIYGGNLDDGDNENQLVNLFAYGLRECWNGNLIFGGRKKGKRTLKNHHRKNKYLATKRATKRR